MPDGNAVEFTGTSVAGTSSAVGAPGGGTVIQSCQPPAGTWDIEVYVGISGTTTAAGDSNNWQIVYNGVVIAKPLPVAVTTTGTNGMCGPFHMRVQVDGAHAIQVQTVVGGNAASFYAASLVASRAGL